MAAKVLIADDEKDVVAFMSKKITREGYQVIEAFDGQEAWEKIQSELPDVVLLDLNMPRMDGFEVLKNIRESKLLTKWIPVVIISANGELDGIKKGFSLEADHYLVKPCSVTDILKAIRLMVSLIPQRKSSTDI